MNDQIITLLNPPVIVIEPRKRVSTNRPVHWYALCDFHGTALRFVQRRSESEAREELALDPLFSFNRAGKVKKVDKPSLGWANGRIRQNKAKIAMLQKENALLEVVK